MSHYKLTYFDIRGVVEPCRLIFAYAGVSYEDHRIPYGGLTPEKKQELQLPWGQLPILEVDGKILSQSRTLMMYLAKKFNLLGANEWEEVKCNEYVDAFLSDYVLNWSKVFVEQDENKKNQLIKYLAKEVTPKFLANVTGHLIKNGTGFFVGSSLTVADILLAHYLTHFETCFDMKLTSGFPEIQKHIETVFNQPGIKEWVSKRPVTKF